MAHIKVAGVGGLGLVVVALAVALDVPEIGQSQAISAVLGILFAVGLIIWRRRRSQCRRAAARWAPTRCCRSIIRSRPRTRRASRQAAHGESSPYRLSSRFAPGPLALGHRPL